MYFLNYFSSSRQAELRAHLQKADWGAARFLLELLEKDTFHETLGGWGELYFLMDDDKPVAFATLTGQDCIRDESMVPWIGFVFTYPEYRRQRHLGRLLDQLAREAAHRGYSRVYVATDHVGVYERFGFFYYKNQVSIWGDDDRILVREL